MLVNSKAKITCIIVLLSQFLIWSDSDKMKKIIYTNEGVIY